MSMLENVPLTSRKRAEETWFFLHKSLTVFMSRCTESVVVWPGLAPKWWLGSKCSFSHIVTTISVMHALRRQASPFERTIGCHTDGDE